MLSPCMRMILQKGSLNTSAVQNVIFNNRTFRWMYRGGLPNRCFLLKNRLPEL
jgi:hypothetical protein